MGKCVIKTPQVILGGVDISPWFRSLVLPLTIGELCECKLTLLDTEEIIKVTKVDGKKGRVRSELYGFDWPRPRPRLRFAFNDVIEVGGFDVSGWVSGYSRLSSIGEADTITLDLQCDDTILSINGTHPWVDSRAKLVQTS